MEYDSIWWPRAKAKCLVECSKKHERIYFTPQTKTTCSSKAVWFHIGANIHSFLFSPLQHTTRYSHHQRTTKNLLNLCEKNICLLPVTIISDSLWASVFMKRARTSVNYFTSITNHWTCPICFPNRISNTRRLSLCLWDLCFHGRLTIFFKISMPWVENKKKIKIVNCLVRPWLFPSISTQVAVLWAMENRERTEFLLLLLFCQI